MLLSRPEFQLRSLPIPIRWEATRRHPYYQIYWSYADQCHEQGPSDDQETKLIQQGAFAMLASIGVSGRPPSPATEFNEIDAGQANLAWLSGAVHPVTLRGLAGILLAWLPKDAAAKLAELLCLASQREQADQPPKVMQALEALAFVRIPGFDGFPNEPFVSINPAASERQVLEALNPLMKQWKKERGLKQRRDWSENFRQYFRAFDVREGWQRGTYGHGEKTLEQTAKLLHRPLGTVTDAYYRAFELITGHNYTPETWVHAFGALKLSAFALWAHDQRIIRRRPLKSRQKREVTETRLERKRDEDRRGTVVPRAMNNADGDMLQLVDDIRQLLKRGRTDREIVEELGLSDNAFPAVNAIRIHFDGK